MKKLISFLLSLFILFSTTPLLASAEENTDTAVNLAAPSAILMEASTGTIIYEKNANEQLRPASITKIMTLLLIFDAISENRLALTDTVTVSEYAASMGGSQVFLEPGETQTVDDMIKCISVASANDACVAVAEHLCGSESEFVAQMNERAKGLGMNDTHFMNCNGLDTDGHITTAHDVALMSRELITKHPEVHNYSTIWMDTITHVTKKGSTEFGLANTNKFLKQYEWATGLKTGSTSLAKYCVSATAHRNDIDLIAVIMAAPDYKVRFADAVALLNYGYGKCSLFSDENTDPLPPLLIYKGVKDSVPCKYEGAFHYLDIKGSDLKSIEKEIIWNNEINAPVTKNDIAGYAVYQLNGTEIGRINILFSESVEKAGLKDYLLKIVKAYCI